MRVGTVCYCTEQGLGRLAKDYYEAGVITDVLLMLHPSYPNHREWYPAGTPCFRTKNIQGPEVNEFLNNIDVILFFETPFDWSLLPRCKERGVKTVMMPMYEWFPRHPSFRQDIDLFLCPSKLDLEYFPEGVYIPVPVDPTWFKLRRQATRFLHNAGHIGHRNHKGTEELIAAVPLLDSGVRLTIRSQSDRIYSLIDKMKGSPGLHKLDVYVGELPYETLFNDYDVYVAPEKFNGLSLPLQEAYAAGLPVITTDRFPVNEWLPKDLLIKPESFHEASIHGNLPFQEAVVTPQAIADKINEWNGRDIRDHSLAALDWAHNHSWPVLFPRIMEALTP